MKYIKLLIISVFVFFISIIFVSASTKTYTRTKDKPLVPKDVKVTDSNIEKILKTPAVSSKEKIYDFADLYTKEEEKKLYDKMNEYIDLVNIDLAIVTTKDLNGISSTKDYAISFYDYNDFKKNGIILVIYLNNSGFSLYMNLSGGDKGLIDIYTKKRIDDTLAYISSFYAKKDYYTGTDKYLGLLKGYYVKYSKKDNKNISNKNIPLVGIIVLSITSTFVIVMLLFYKLKDKSRGDKDILDEKIDTTTLMVKLEKDEIITDEK